MTVHRDRQPPALPNAQNDAPSAPHVRSQSPPPLPRVRSQSPPPLPNRSGEHQRVAQAEPRASVPPPNESGGSGTRDAESHDADLPVLELKPFFEPGEEWGRLRINDEIGQGAMAYVLRASDTKLRREVALKVTPMPRDEFPRELLARFIEEAQITAQLEHPNIVPVHELGLAPDGRVYFSMKLVRGRSLQSILDARREGDAKTLEEFGLRRLLDVFLQVCQAIAYAHSRGIVHRDLKPANIMVGDFGEVLVMDWGVAKVLGRADRPMNAVIAAARSERPPPLSGPEVSSVRSGKHHLATQVGTIIGTPAYMSPEQAKGAEIDERADLYALGVILYEMLSGQLPFDAERAEDTLAQVRSVKPRLPSDVNPATPPGLEALTMLLLEKDPDQRTLTIPEIRSHIQSYIEGIERDYRRESLWSGALWVTGAMCLFAFLVWYVTGESIAAIFVLAPATVFNAFGWFLVMVALGYPLWSSVVALRQGRVEHGPFSKATDEDLFVSGFLAHRTFAAAITPLFQLAFIGELAFFAVVSLTKGEGVSADFVRRVMSELRAGWARALIVLLAFLFAYLFFLYREVKFARRIDRYETLVVRSRWEAVWPMCLIGVLLLTLALTKALDWVVLTDVPFASYVKNEVLGRPVDVFDVVKTLVFQGTFLMGLVFATVLLAFPVAEVLAALRLPYQPADEAAVTGRAQYFLRSLAVFRVARVNWLYGGAMIGGLTALTILSKEVQGTLLEQVLYVLGPSLVGYAGYSATRRQVRRLLRASPAIHQMVDEQVTAARKERLRVRIERLSQKRVQSRLLALLAPLACIAGFLLFTGSGLHKQAIRNLVVPVSAEGWLLILPYVLLTVVVLVGDWLQLSFLRRRAE